MAHPINDKLNKFWGVKATPCNSHCRYWRFPHLEVACCLSEVFSVRKGELCYEFQCREEKDEGLA